MAQEIPVTQARAQLSDLVNQVSYSGERVVLTRHGRALVVLVSAVEFERYERWLAAQRVDRPAEGDDVRPGAGRLHVVETSSVAPYEIAAAQPPAHP